MIKVFALAAITVLFPLFREAEPILHVITGKAQGTTYTIKYFHPDNRVSSQSIDSTLKSLDRSLSLYQEGSLIRRFNASADTLTVDAHMINVVKRAQEISRQTRGLFDLSIGPLVSLWGFGPEGSKPLPGHAEIKSALNCVGYQQIKIRGNRIQKTRPCLQIDANGIAQGYSVDVLADYLEKKGVHNYLVELGGEIRVKGGKPGGEKFKVGIESPDEDEWKTGRMEQVVELENGAITTSGSYKKYYESQGKKITHLVDPRTGYTVQNNLISVTVYAKDAMTADGFDNALMLMGMEKALKFVEKRKDISAFFIFKRPDGSVADTASRGFMALLKK